VILVAASISRSSGSCIAVSFLLETESFCISDLFLWMQSVVACEFGISSRFGRIPEDDAATCEVPGAACV